MKINPLVAAAAVQRYERIVSQKQTAPLPLAVPDDKVELSDRAQLYATLLTAAQQAAGLPDARIHGLINRVSAGIYTVDVDRIADRMLGLPADPAADGEEGETL
jgi:anti-sigma28 factor (negative regulator of flagellin synthesis)